MSAYLSAEDPVLAQPHTPVTVRGRSGQISGGRISGHVVVQLADGRWLSVAGTETPADILRITNDLAIAPFRPLTWLGRP